MGGVEESVAGELGAHGVGNEGMQWPGLSYGRVNTESSSHCYRKQLFACASSIQIMCVRSIRRQGF